MRGPAIEDYCNGCQDVQWFVNPLPDVDWVLGLMTAGIIPLAIALLRWTLLPWRCVHCLQVRSLSKRAFAAQSPDEINRRLMIPGRPSRDSLSTGVEIATQYDLPQPADIEVSYASRFSDYIVGSRHERILHVARIHPEFPIIGVGSKLFYLLLLPITGILFW